MTDAELTAYLYGAFLTYGAETRRTPDECVRLATSGELVGRVKVARDAVGHDWFCALVRAGSEDLEAVTPPSEWFYRE